MRAYLIKRLLLMFLTLWGITLISFLMLQMTPGSPLEMKFARGPAGSLGEHSHITEEAMDLMKKQFHLDKPPLVQYGMWLKSILTLDFGISFTDRRPVIDKIKERLPVSLVFGLSGIFVAILLGIPLGLFSGIHKNSLFDRLTAFAVIAMFSVPSYVLGIYLLTFFGGGDFLDLFPIYGIQSDHYDTLSWFGKLTDRLHHFILPCLCYTIGSLAFITQLQRGSILEALNQDYIRTARAKGVPENKVFFKHAFRNSLIPIATVLAGIIPAILGGSIIIETIFSIPGIGLLSFEALLQRDYPLMMANFTIFAFLSLLGILLSDICYVLVDPRISFEGR